MSVLKNKDGRELLLDCNCGCDRGIRLRIDKEDSQWYCFLSYTNGSFYSEQGDGLFGTMRKKLRKIWAILRNKDYYYAVITMTKEEFETFREYINSIDPVDSSVAYICDEKACEECQTGEARYCYHTTDIRHAANFKKVAPGKYMEKE